MLILAHNTIYSMLDINKTLWVVFFSITLFPKNCPILHKATH